MGVVYRALQLDLDRPVALKLIAAAAGRGPDVPRALRARVARRRLDRPPATSSRSTTRARATAALYIAMRYVEGSRPAHARARRAAPRARRARRTSSPRSRGALDAAHARGIVHRDVKPANVLLGAGDHAYLTDFGLTKRVTSHTGSTRDGGWVGTLGYVAPEQIRGERVDARADVYALGCVLYHALTGVPPYQRESDEATLWAHLHDDPPSLRDARARTCPRASTPSSTRALAKDPDDRFPSAGDLGRAALAAAGPAGGAGGPSASWRAARPRPATARRPSSRPTRRRPSLRRRARRAGAAGCGRGRWPRCRSPALALVAALALGGGDDGGGGDGTGATTATSTAHRRDRRRRRRRRSRASTSAGGPTTSSLANGKAWVVRSGNDRLARDRRQDRQARSPTARASGDPTRRGRRLRHALGRSTRRAVAGRRSG